MIKFLFLRGKNSGNKRIKEDSVYGDASPFIHDGETRVIEY